MCVSEYVCVCVCVCVCLCVCVYVCAFVWLICIVSAPGPPERGRDKCPLLLLIVVVVVVVVVAVAVVVVAAAAVVVVSSFTVSQTDMHWARITVDPSTATVFVVSADNMADPRPGDALTWHFGVATIAGSLSHGITWNTCSFNERGQGQSVHA